MRWEFGAAFRASKITAGSYSSSGPVRFPIELSQVHVVVLGDGPPGKPYSVGILVPAERAFDETVTPEAIVQSTQIREGCVDFETIQEADGGAHTDEHFHWLEENKGGG
jgi:hypothetical protein